MKVQLAYGRVDPAIFGRCPRCQGTGQEETGWETGIFGICPYCTGSGVHDQQRAFTYRSDVDLAVGDIVSVPATWLDKQHGEHGAKEATVVRLGSDYKGPIVSILKVIERVQPQ